MKKNVSAFASLAVGLALSIASVHAQDQAAAARKIYTDQQDSVIWVSAVCKISFTADTKDEPVSIPEQERKQEALATVVTADGLVVSALSALDVSREISGREVPTRTGRVKLDASVVFKEMFLVMPDGTEVPAEVVLKDVDLDLVFIRAKADSKEFKSVKFKPIDLANTAKPAISDDVVTLARMDEVLNRQPSVIRGQVTALVKVPREFIRVSTISLGGPAFTADGKLIGIGVNRISKGRNSAPVILPASEVKDLAEQAKNAKADSKPAESK